jgi:acetylornithine deacetylase/succinyl-diaminopimelate desuccinylase-like protein
MDPLQLLADRYEQSLHELTTFLAIPSVSTDPDTKDDVQRCSAWLAEHIRSTGFEDVRIIDTAGHPIVYAEDLSAGPTKPTVLFYGHYDVQPVDPLHLWTNPPFEPTVRNGRVYARGATDDKGQVFLHIKALQALRMAEGGLPLNVKLLIEGEEEIGSPHLAPFVSSNAGMLQCDAVVVSDTPMFAPGIPSLVYGLRGLAYMQIDVTGPNRDLHSGSYGGAVNNPLNTLAHILAQLKDESGRILIPGFYDDVLDVSVVEREELAALGYDDAALMSDVGTDSLFGESGYSTPERLWTRPTLDVNGLLGGFTGEGAKTVLPSKAMAKVSMRLVPHQRTTDIAAKFEAYIQTLVQPGITVTVRDLHGADPVLVPRDTPAMHAAVRALEATYGQRCRFTREGGSIPVVLLFETALKSPTVLMGFGLNNENAHSPDEHFSLENFRLGMDAAVRFYQEFGMAQV